MEIRLHGRGGQGGVTCAKILAAIYAGQGKSVQTFGDYAGERSGAPVRAYTRVSDGAIDNRNKVYRPDHLLVLDPTLLGSEILEGLAPGGTLLLNSPKPLSAFDGSYGEFRLAVVDATRIARKHRIGTRSVIIVNTTIAGAFVKVQGIPLELLQAAYELLGFMSNYDAAVEACDAVEVREAEEAPRADQGGMPAADRVVVEPLVLHTESPPTPLRTGSWRSQTPRYVQKLAPCSAWCPAGNDVVGFIQELVRHGVEEASAVLARSSPLPGVCGRVCAAPCMEGCNRREYDGSVNIRALERYIGDHGPRLARPDLQTGKVHRFAVVGSGPAGLAAAYTLRRYGQEVTIFEGEKELGGVLRTGIPSYRLPREVLDREIKAILDLGVKVEGGRFLGAGDVEGLAGSFDAVIVATGLARLRELAVEGAELAGIEQGMTFLHRVNMEGGGTVDGHVVVLGGGNTAMDCARSALRSGASKVTIAYRRSEVEMPAIREEIEEGRHEGIAFLFLRQPVAFSGEGSVKALVLAEVDLGEPDETGRRRPIVSDRTHTLACEHVLLALGQSADRSLFGDSGAIRESRVEGASGLLFASGDLSTGDGTVTHAIGDGRRAAARALSALDLDVEPFERPSREEAVPATDIRFDHFVRAAPALAEANPVDSRVRTFDEVNQGLDSPMEAHRCFSCGSCTRCDTCLVYCPEGIIRRWELAYDVDYTYCKGCGICVEECPRRAMEMEAS